MAQAWPAEEGLTGSSIVREGDGHEPFSDHALEVGPGNKLLPNIAALAEGDGVQPIQVVLQGHC